MHARSLPLLLLLVACAGAPNQLDPAGLSREDYQALRDRSPPPAAPASPAGPPIPELLSSLEMPQAPDDLAERLISISVSDGVPLRDVLSELAREAGLNLELDPGISGGVIFSATDQPLDVVLSRICDLAGLRYRIEGPFLRIERDTPYLATYPLDYLSLARRTRSQVGIATNVFAAVEGESSSDGGGGGSGAGSLGGDDPNSGNNSVTLVEAESLADFWSEVEQNMAAIMASTGSPPAPLPASDADAGATAAAVPASHSLNRQAGLVTIFGTERQQRAVADYLLRLRRSATSQVLIEARIVEVTLTEAYRSGINWRSLLGGAIEGAARFGGAATGAPFSTSTSATDNLFTVSLQDADIAGIVNWVREFGAVRTLSSPRLTVLNNQTAVLKVAENDVYFTSTVESTPVVGTSGAVVSVSRTVNSTPNTVPVGLVMTVQPAIDSAREEITLTLRPTISRILRRVRDPAVAIAAADAGLSTVVSEIPVVEVRELDSVLRLQSGTVAIMGGLMQDRSVASEEGVPPFDRLPVAEYLARGDDRDSRVVELVILLRATIVDQATPDQADNDLYHRYHRDPRPLIQPPAR